jgi:hypothetical protein
MMNDGAATVDLNDYANVTTEMLRVWIREAEGHHTVAAEGSKEQQGAQRLIDKYCAELGRRGED